MINLVLGIFLAVVLIVALVVLVMIVLASQAGSSLNKEEYRSSWLKIENNFQVDNLASYQVAVLEADKLLDKALRGRHIKGETMGERMKSAQNIWKNPDLVWSAHKLRNKLAHEADFEVKYKQAAQALRGFKQGLKDLGAI